MEMGIVRFSNTYTGGNRIHLYDILGLLCSLEVQSQGVVKHAKFWEVHLASKVEQRCHKIGSGCINPRIDRGCSKILNGFHFLDRDFGW